MLVPAALSNVPCGLASSAANIALATNLLAFNPANRLAPQYQRAVRIIGVTAVASSIGIAVLAGHVHDYYNPDIFSPGREPSKASTVRITPSAVNIKFSGISSYEASVYTSLAVIGSESSPGSGTFGEGNSLDGSSQGDAESVSEFNGSSADIIVIGGGSEHPGEPSGDAAISHGERAHTSAAGSSTGPTGGSPPPPPPPSFTASGMDNKDDPPSKSFLTWKSILVALALLAGLYTAFRRRRVHGEASAVEHSSSSTTFEDNQDSDVLYCGSLWVIEDMPQAPRILRSVMTVGFPVRVLNASDIWDRDPLPSPVSFPSVATPIRIDATASLLGVVNAAGSKLSEGCQQGQQGVIDRLMYILNFMLYLVIASLIVLLSALTVGLLTIISTLEKNSVYQRESLPSPIVDTEVEPVEFLPMAIRARYRDDDEDLGTPLDDGVKPPITDGIRVRYEDEDSDNWTIPENYKWMNELFDRIHDICAASALAHAQAAQLAEKEATNGTIVQETPQPHERDDAGTPVIADDSPATILEDVVIDEVEVAVGEAVHSTLASSSGFDCEVVAVVDNEQTLASSLGFNFEVAAVVESTPPLPSVSTPGLTPDAPVFTPETALPQHSSMPVFGTPFDDAVRPPIADATCVRDRDEDEDLGTPLDEAGKPLIADDSPATVLEGVISEVGASVGEAVHATVASSSGFDCEATAVVESTPPLSSVSTPGLNPDAPDFTPETPPPRPSSIPVYVPGRRRRKRRRRGPQETPAEGSISD